MKRVTCLKIAVIVAVVVFSMQFLPPLQSPITSPIVVTLSQDQPVAYSAAKVNELLDGQAAVYSVSDAVAQALILPRAVGAVVFVGHGSPDTVKIGNAMVSWEAFVDSNLAPLQSNQIYLATCYSEKATEELTQKYGHSNVVVDFKGYVDADYAAYFVSAMIASSRGDFSKTMGLLNELSHVMIGKMQTPERYNHWLLGSQWVRGIYHTKYGTPYGATSYKYTHPDWSYYGLNIESQWGANAGQNLAVAHIKKSVVDTNNLLSILTNSVAGIAVAALLSGGLALAVVFVLALAGIAEYVFVEAFVKDELGSGWFWVQNVVQWWSGMYLYQIIDFKIGGFPWVRLIWPLLFGFIPMTPWFLPCGYGGQDLGIDGM